MTTKKWWRESPRFKKTKHIDPSLPSDKYLKITSSLNRRQTSLLTQLRTGHAPINKHLHRIGKNDTPNCPQATCRGITEDVHHLIFTCPRNIHERYHLKRSIGKRHSPQPIYLPTKKPFPTHSTTSIKSDDSDISMETLRPTRRDNRDVIASRFAFEQLEKKIIPNRVVLPQMHY